MANYDPKFQEIAKRGDILVSGRNFGTGSSREQAATALASRGIQCVIAATSSQTYKRNAFNNGFIVLECPDLVDHLMSTLAPDPKIAPRTIPGPTITIDYQRGIITCGNDEYPFPALSPTAQELIAAGGSEAVVRNTLAAT
jgi:homoaconitate hydratase